MNSQISLCVVVPTYNRAEKLRRMVKSIVAQTVLPEQIIVVNDGSITDYSEVKIWAQSVPQLLWIEIPNGGVSIARNHGVSAAQTAFIAFCDDDDYFLPNHIESLKNRIRLEGAAKGIYHTHRVELRNDEFQTPPIIKCPEKMSWQEYYVTNGEMIPSCTCMHRDIVVEHPFPANIKYAEDHEQRLKALRKFPCFPIYEVTVVMDRTDETATNRSVSELADIYRIRFRTMFANPAIGNHIRWKFRHEALFRWSSLEMSEARTRSSRLFLFTWLRAAFRIRTFSNFKTWVMNFLWFLKHSKVNRRRKRQ